MTVFMDMVVDHDAIVPLRQTMRGTAREIAPSTLCKAVLIKWPCDGCVAV